MNNDFTTHLIKGKITEVIFQQMFREQGVVGSGLEL